MTKYYAGIGSRTTPPDVLEIMSRTATILSQNGYVLRSGGASGADTAFEKGSTSSEVYLPWTKFNGNCSHLIVTDAAIAMAAEYHPLWDRLPRTVRMLMGRNCHQILGMNLNAPVKFVLCYTPDGCESSRNRTSKTGGTGLAISVADAHKIPIFNLKNSTALSRLSAFIGIDFLQGCENESDLLRFTD